MKISVSNKEKFIWNMLGSLSNAFSSLILSICVNRFIGGESGGIFAFAYSNAQLMLTVGQCEVRPYQSTDINEKYSFNSYFSLRMITCMLMIIITGIYVWFNDFSYEKGVVVFTLSMFKMIEAFTDVFAGRFQQKDRIDLSGKIFFVRVVSSTIVFILLIITTKSLMLSSIGMFITSFTLFWLYDRKHLFIEDRKGLAFEYRDLRQLFVEILPLFIGSFVMMYINNAPKYAINELCGDEIQNIYNILFMPAFVINLFSLFVFRPMLVTMAMRWNLGELKMLRSILLKMYIVIVGLTGIALVGTWLCGIPILSIVYGIDLQEYKLQLLMVMTTGGISALLTFSTQVITIMRKQRIMLIGYGIVFLYTLIASKIFVNILEIEGAILAYGTSIGMLVLFSLAIIVLVYINKRKSLEK